MRNLTFNGPGHRLRLPSGRTVDRGDTGEVTDADAKAADTAPNVDVTITSSKSEPAAADGGEGPTPDHDHQE